MRNQIVAFLFLFFATACTNSERPRYLYADIMQSSYLDSVVSVGELKFQTLNLQAMSDGVEEVSGSVKVLNYVRTLNLDTVGLMGMVISCDVISDSTIILGLSTGEVAVVDHRNFEVIKSFSTGKGPGEFLDPRFVSANNGIILVNDIGLMRSTLIDDSDLQTLRFLPTNVSPFSITLSDGKLTYIDAKELEKGFILLRESVSDNSSVERFRLGLAFENLDWIHNKSFDILSVGDWYLLYSISIPHIMVFDKEFRLSHVVSLKHDEIRKGFTDPLPDGIRINPPDASWRIKIFRGMYADEYRALVNTTYGFVVLDFSGWTMGTDVPWEYIPGISLVTTLKDSEVHFGLTSYVPSHVSMKGSQFMACPVQQEFVDFFEVTERK